MADPLTPRQFRQRPHPEQFRLGQPDRCDAHVISADDIAAMLISPDHRCPEQTFFAYGKAVSPLHDYAGILPNLVPWTCHLVSWTCHLVSWTCHLVSWT